MSIQSIKTTYHTGYSWTKRQALVVAAAFTVALVAIGLGVLALQAIGGTNIGIFHSLGGMSDIGAWILISVGSSILTFVTLYLSNKFICHRLNLSKMKNCLTLNRKMIDAAFVQLAAQKTLSGFGRTNKGKVNASEAKFCPWQPPDDPNSSEAIVFVLQMKGDKRVVTGFVITKTQDESKPDATEVGPYSSYLEKLDGEGYRFTPCSLEDNPLVADYTDHNSIN